MAVRNDFAAGEVLAAADLNDTFASKANYPSGGSNGDLLTKSGTTTAWAAPSVAGMTLITSTALSGSTVSLNNVFTATYQHYVITLDYVPSTGMQVRLRLRVSGTDDTGSNYAYSNWYYTPAAQTASLNNGNPGTANVIGEGVGTDPGHLVFEVMNPALTVRTRFAGMGTYSNNGLIHFCVHSQNTAYDGVTVYTSTGTFTSGNIRVYGYRNS